MILIGNKIDKEGNKSIINSRAQLWCSKHGNIPYFETSATENVSVEEAFFKVAKLAFEKHNLNKPSFFIPESAKTNNIRLSAIGEDFEVINRISDYG